MLAFAVIAAPEVHGDGWSIADTPGGKAVARLVLPGEARIYGALDYLADDERWQLAAGPSYAVAVRADPRRRTATLPVIEALAAPVEIGPSLHGGVDARGGAGGDLDAAPDDPSRR
jgi:hypothetical protein